jgi:hypothetical protein
MRKLEKKKVLQFYRKKYGYIGHIKAIANDAGVKAPSIYKWSRYVPDDKAEKLIAASNGKLTWSEV